MSRLQDVIGYDVIANRPAASIPGRLYYATDTHHWYRDNGSSWDAADSGVSGGGGLLAANNLSDLASAASARTNLGLGSAATQASSAFLQVANNLSDLANAATARTNLGLGTAATLASDTDGTLAANSDSRLATQKAVKTYVDSLIAANDAMVYKGVIDCSANPNYPAADAGHTYRVSVAGKIGGASGTNVEVADLLLCITDGSVSGNQATVGSHWEIVQANLDGAVTGPASSTSSNFATFNGTSGKVIQDSGIALDTDGTLAANSDAKIASQKAVKTYVAAQIASVTGGGGAGSGDMTKAVYDTNADGLIDVAAGGTGASTAANARTNLSAAKSGANTDITSLLGITGQVEWAKGAAIASANNLALGSDGNTFHITGTTQVNLLSSTGWQAGSVVLLIFDGALTVKNNQTVSGSNKPILLYGGVDYVTAANSVLALVYDGTSWFDLRLGLSVSGITANQKIAPITAVFDGGGSALVAGSKVRVRVPYACTITAATTLVDQSGSVAIEVRKCTYAQYDAGSTHPVTGDKISASAPPTVSSATKAQDLTLTGWTTSLSAGDIIEFYISSVTTCTWCAITLDVTKS